MKKSILKKLNINRESLRELLKHALSPVFLILLLTSFVLWYTTKLGKEYTTQMPINVQIDGRRYKLTAEVHGKGSTLMAQRLALKSKINIALSELSVKPSPDDLSVLVITPASMLKAINAKTSDIKVLQIIDMPDFDLEQSVPEEGEL